MKKGSISLRCALLGISRDTYYQFPKRTAARKERDEPVTRELRRIAETKKFKLGIRTLTMAYNRAHHAAGVVINHKKVARIKREYNIPTKIRRKHSKRPEQPKRTENVCLPGNIVDRRFNVPTPFRCVGTDVTYLWLPRLGRFAYASLARDFATGEHLGWSLSLHNDQELVDTTLADIEHRTSTRIGYLYVTRLSHGSWRYLYAETLPFRHARRSRYHTVNVAQRQLYRQCTYRIWAWAPQGLARPFTVYVA